MKKIGLETKVIQFALKVDESLNVVHNESFKLDDNYDEVTGIDVTGFYSKGGNITDEDYRLLVSVSDTNGNLIESVAATRLTSKENLAPEDRFAPIKATAKSNSLEFSFKTTPLIGHVSEADIVVVVTLRYQRQ